MEAIVALLAGHRADAVQSWARQAGAQLVALYPGAQDADGQRWYHLQCANASRLPALVAQLQGHADVEAAYLKPEGSAPDA
jgi:hypothetical protein